MRPTVPPSPRRVWRPLALVLLACCLAAGSLHATNYYVDPATGNMANPGTAASPWSTLAAVFVAKKTFAADDVIYLRAGYHGAPAVKGLNTGSVTIQPDGAAVPTLSRLTFVSAKNWVVSGLDICPENVAAGAYSTAQLVNLDGASSYITIQNCDIRSANSINGWTQQNWYDRAASGLLTYAPYTTFAYNKVTNTSFSIAVVKAAHHSLISHCTITNFYNDGIRGLSDFSTYEYNTILNSFVSDANHDDCFQGWSTGTDGVSGHGTIYNVTIRNNLLMGRTDVNQPLYAGPQGISNFDGFSENWLIENNVIFCSTYHGIALSGATNCQILNNTALPNPLDGAGAITPWITIYEHKNSDDGTPWPVKSSGNLIRNNLAARKADGAYVFPATAGTADHNIVTTAYTTFFRNFAGFDAALLSTAPAVNAGLDTVAPPTDFLDHPRATPFDIGAYEYLPPADATNLAVSEIMYRPGAPTTAERAAGFTDAEAFEFIELQNISPTRTILLTGARFTAGVAFTLSDAVLAPGARAMLVGNRAAFAKRYGSTGFTILGEYQPASQLANTGGRLTLLSAQGQTIRDFVYSDHAPWPASPNGGGYSLVLINPASNPDPADPANWRASVALGGNPGKDDALTFKGDPAGDDNGDGTSNLVHYALAGAAPLQLPVVSKAGGFLTLTFRRSLGADDARVAVQRSTNLVNWTGGADVGFVSEAHNADGTATYVWRSTHPASEGAREFLRLRVTLP